MLTNSLKKRFCKDMNIPIQVYDEPYFSERIELLDPYYDTINKLEVFKQAVEKYENENEYYQQYNEIKDKAISYLEERLCEFQTVDINKYKIVNQTFSSNNIYKETNIDKQFISIDMKEANFSCLKHFDTNIFPDVDNYKDFIKQFTNEEHFINSKYIRQVVFGNQNPKRQIRYQKHLMDNLLTIILSTVNKDNIISFSNDEIIIKVDDEIENIKETLFSLITKYSEDEQIRFRVEEFMLGKAYTGYKKVYKRYEKVCERYEKVCERYKKAYKRCNKVYKGDEVSFKGLNSIDIIYAIKEHENKEVTDNDKVFIYENKLARFL